MRACSRMLFNMVMVWSYSVMETDMKVTLKMT